MNKVVEIGFNEYATMEDFYRITMLTKDNKKLYLTEDYWCGKNAEKLVCKWTFAKANALWFETLKQAEEFAKDYFKNFTQYKIEGFSEII